MGMMRHWAATAAVPLLLLTTLTACGPQPSAGNPDPEVGSMDADEVVLRVAHTGGFVPPQVLVGRLPTVTVYGDGRLITEGPVPAIYPGPALPNLQVSTISDADVDGLVQRAEKAGVGGKPDLGQPPIADAPNTRFTVRRDGATKELEVYALAESGSGGLTPAQEANRKALRDLLDAVTGAVGASQQYEATAVAAIATPYVAGTEPGLEPPAPVAWPGPALPGESMGDGLELGCVVAEGEQARAVLTAAAQANANTPWTSGGKTWSLVLRPLLPDETGCADLRAAS
jgi:hypothetical protein